MYINYFGDNFKPLDFVKSILTHLCHLILFLYLKNKMIFDSLNYFFDKSKTFLHQEK
jgi:phage gp36-like protein